MSVYTVLATILSFILPGFAQSYISLGMLYFLYYFGMELIFGRTLGKMVTNTKVITTRNKRPTVFHILARTLIRFASPFDVFSYLMGKEQGMHDALSHTRLIKIEKFN